MRRGHTGRAQPLQVIRKRPLSVRRPGGCGAGTPRRVAARGVPAPGVLWLAEPNRLLFTGHWAGFFVPRVIRAHHCGRCGLILGNVVAAPG
jgi:hypothetical protein